MTYAEELAANRRLEVLRLLMEDRGHSSARILELALHALGHRAGLDRDYVLGLLDFLEKAGLVTTELVRDRETVAHLTERGAGVARGDLDCAGVARPPFGA